MANERTAGESTNSEVQTSSSDTDDDVSVIAVIRKGSGPSDTLDSAGSCDDCDRNPAPSIAPSTSLPDDRANGGFPANESRQWGKPRVIELSDKISKMELRRQFEVRTEPSPAATPEKSGAAESLEILQKLPPGTVLIKHESREYGGDSDYVRESSKDSTETNSSGSSGTSVAAGKIKRVHRTTRNKIIVEAVRRNPTRVTKKDADEDFPRPRQRLLSAKRRQNFGEILPAKRTRSSTMPYMNTRSVTRKLYTVGATHQPPTARDRIEWKEWPVHGMHERPVYHPQIGLAAEYLGRYFTSFDGETYREVLIYPGVEVVSVDPHPERTLSWNSKRRGKRGRSKNRDASDGGGARESLRDGNATFEVCMHNSLHSVFAYCAQVMTPTCEKTLAKKVDEPAARSERDAGTTKEIASTSEAPSDKKTLNKLVKEVRARSKQDFGARKIPGKIINVAKCERVPTGAGSASKSSQTSTISSYSRVSEPPRYLTIPRETAVTLSKMKSVQTTYVKLQESLQNPSKNTLIFVRAAEAVPRTEKTAFPKKYGNPNRTAATTTTTTTTTTSDLSLTKLEDTAISDEALMEMSSIYKKFLPKEELPPSRENSPAKDALSKRSMISCAKQQPALSKVLLNKTTSLGCVASASPRPTERQRGKTVAVTEVDRGCRLPRYEITNARSTTNPANPYSSPNKSWNASETSEIARILSEYNRNVKRQGAQLNSGHTASKSLNAEVLRSKLNGIKLQNRARERKAEERTLIDSGVIRVEEKTDPKSRFWRDAATCGAISNNSEKDSSEHRRKENSEDVREASKKPREEAKDSARVDGSEEKTRWLGELMENTAVLYCAAAGVHQDDLADYVDTLDSKQSIQWLEEQNM